jgi:hypothetical protein
VFAVTVSVSFAFLCRCTTVRGSVKSSWFSVQWLVSLTEVERPKDRVLKRFFPIILLSLL